jgi:AbrB family looped-hinge helix DNA binding protein
MATATITSKGQVTIPRRVRDRLHWKTGDRLEFSVDASGRVLVELAAGDIRDLRGILHRPGQKPVSVAEMNEAIHRHAAEDFLRSVGRGR